MRTKLGLGLMLIATACGTEGERAEHGCPEATCTTATPYGLRFRGPGLSDSVFTDNGPLPVAIGGTQTIDIDRLDSWGFGDDFDRRFEAMTPGGTFEVLGVSPPHVSVRGMEVGSDLLRITDAADVLHDRITLHTRGLEGVELVPGNSSRTEEGPWFLYNGPDTAAAAFVVRLYGPGDTRIVDDSMTVAPDGLLLDQHAWDGLTLEGRADAASVTANVAGQAIAIPVATVDWVGSLWPVAGQQLTLAEGTAMQLCFDAKTEGATVVGLTWVYETYDAGVDLSASALAPAGECVTVEGLDEGPAFVTATAGGRSTTVEVLVYPADHDDKPVRRSGVPMDAGADGERAGLLSAAPAL